MYRALMILAAVNGIGFGLPSLFLPDVVLSVLAGKVDPFGRTILQMLGGLIVGYGFIVWSLRGLERGPTRRAVILGVVASFVPVALLAAVATMSGLVNLLGWAIAVVHALVAVGLAWTLLERPSAA